MAIQQILAAYGGGGGPLGFAALVASLNPDVWLRLNDNAASSVVVDSAASPSNGTLYAAVNGSALATKNTSTVSTTGLVTGDSDKAFAIGGNSMVTSPYKAMSGATGWTAIAIIQPPSVPVSSGVGVVFQFTGTGVGVPELDVLDIGGGLFRFRVMFSGVGEVTMDATPSFAYGTKVAVIVKKEASGRVKVFANGTLISTSTAADPNFTNQTDVLRWGAAQFGSATTYYSLPGPLDECVLFLSAKSDATCVQLTT